MGRDAFRARHISDQIDRLSDALRSSERRVRGLRRILRFYSTAARRIVPALAALKAVRGWVAEWSNAHAWKACLPQGNQGSNPCPSVPPDRDRSYGCVAALRRVITCNVCRTLTTLALGNTPRKFPPG